MKNILYTVVALLLLSSCDFEKEEEIKFNDRPQLIVNAMMDNEFLGNIVQLRLSGSKETQPVTNATVEMFINGEIIQSVTSTTDEYYIDSIYNPGDEVAIRVVTDDKKYCATSSCVVPEPVTIENVKITRFKNGSHMCSRYNVSIKKHTTGNTYYRLGFSAAYQWYDEYGCVDGKLTFFHGVWNSGTGAYSYDSDVALTNGNPGDKSYDKNVLYKSESATNYFAVFNSHFFTNDEYTLTFDVDDREFDERTVDQGWKRTSEITLYSITADEYYYLRSLNVLADYSDGRLTTNEPITGSNIDGGIGILSASSVAQVNLVDSTRHLTDNGFYTLRQKRHWEHVHKDKGEPWPCDCPNVDELLNDR